MSFDQFRGSEKTNPPPKSFDQTSAVSQLKDMLKGVQWADRDSFVMMEEVLHPPDAPKMLVVCTVRSEGVKALNLSCSNEECFLGYFIS